MPPDTNLQQYYADRAGEYEQVYAIPERQQDLSALKTFLPRILSNQDILEIACGTGYWTQPLSITARSILATDVNNEVIEIAKGKAYYGGNVHFQVADALTLEGVSGNFTAGFAGFWWSHVPLGELQGFLHTFHAKLGPGSLVTFIDNTRAGTRHPFTYTDPEGNTYQTRLLADGREYKVLKNLPLESEFKAHLSGLATDIEYRSLTYYWCLTYRTI